MSYTGKDKIAKEIVDNYQSFFDYENRRLIQKKVSKKKRIVLFAMVYFIFASFTFILFFSDKKGFSNLFSSSKNSDNNLIDRVIKNEALIINLSNELSYIKNNLGETNESKLLISTYNTRLEKIEESQKSIQNTIMSDPSKALSVRLIQDKQDAMKDDVIDVKNAYTNLNSKFDNAMLFALIIPLFGLAYKFVVVNKKDDLS